MGRLASLLLLAFTTAASAAVIPGNPSLVASKIVNGRDIAVSATDLDNFKFFAQYAGAAYCNQDAAAGAIVTCTKSVCPSVTANGATVLLSLDGDTTSNMDGFVALDTQRELIVASFRGSSSVRNWMSNILFLFAPCTAATTGCAVHSGFFESWSQVRDDVLAAVAAAKAANPSYRVVSTGHSLGGAVATIAGAYLRLAGTEADIYTYGSPRVGNIEFAKFVSTQPGGNYRVTHLDDPVPRLPPLFLGYRHTSPEYWLKNGQSNTTSYAPGDIKVCEGYSNIACSGSGLGLDVQAHLFYFQAISACGSDEVAFKRDETSSSGNSTVATLSDEELMQHVNTWAQMDLEYAAELERNGLSIWS